VDEELNSGFYMTGSDPEIVGPGLSAPLWDKHKIEIDLTPSTTTEVQHQNWNSQSLGFYHDAPNQTLYGPMMYFNFNEQKWERIGTHEAHPLPTDPIPASQRGNLTEEQARLRLWLDRTMVGFGQSTQIFTGDSDDRQASSPKSPNSDPAKKIFLTTGMAQPTNTFGFPFHPKFAATGSQVFNVSSVIDRPFLVEKVVYEFSASLSNKTTSADSNPFTRHPEGVTFFILNQRAGNIDPGIENRAVMVRVSDTSPTGSDGSPAPGTETLEIPYSGTIPGVWQLSPPLSAYGYGEGYSFTTLAGTTATSGSTTTVTGVSTSFLSELKVGDSIQLVPRDEEATATVSVSDGDRNLTTASGEGRKITITSTDGTTRVYRVVDSNLSAIATGAVLAANSDTGAGTTADAGDIAVSVPVNGSPGKQNALLVQLKDAIEDENGHDGKIVVGAVPSQADGKQSITLTQLTIGTGGGASRGVTEIVEDFSDAANQGCLSVTNFEVADLKSNVVTRINSDTELLVSAPATAATAILTFTGTQVADTFMVIKSTDGTQVTYSAGTETTISFSDMQFQGNVSAVVSAKALQECIESKAGHGGKIRVHRAGAVLTLTMVQAGQIHTLHSGNFAIDILTGNLANVTITQQWKDGQDAGIAGGTRTGSTTSYIRRIIPVKYDNVDTVRDLVTFSRLATMSSKDSLDLKDDFEKYVVDPRRDADLTVDSPTSWSHQKLTLAAPCRAPSLSPGASTFDVGGNFIDIDGDDDEDRLLIRYINGSRNGMGIPTGRSPRGGEFSGFSKQYELTSGDKAFRLFSPTTDNVVSPYLLKPGDKLVFGFQAPLAYSVYNTGPKFLVHPGAGKLVLYGSVLRNDHELTPESNQPLTSEAVHESLILGTDVYDQFDTEPTFAFSGSYLDKIVGGHMITGSFPTVTSASFHLENKGMHRKVMGYITEGTAGVTGSFLRGIKMADTRERFYDSLLPSVAEMLAVNGDSLFDGRSFQVQATLQSKLFDDTGAEQSFSIPLHRDAGMLDPSANVLVIAEPRSSIQGPGQIFDRDLAFLFPFEPKYSNVSRLATERKGNKTFSVVTGSTGRGVRRGFISHIAVTGSQVFLKSMGLQSYLLRVKDIDMTDVRNNRGAPVKSHGNGRSRPSFTELSSSVSESISHAGLAILGPGGTEKTFNEIDGVTLLNSLYFGFGDGFFGMPKFKKFEYEGGEEVTPVGFTRANQATTITGVDTRFTRDIKVGDRIALSGTLAPEGYVQPGHAGGGGSIISHGPRSYAKITFTNTPQTAPDSNTTITIVSTDGTTKTYVGMGPAAPTPASLEFTATSTAATAAATLKTAIYDAAGHTGDKIEVEDNLDGSLTLYQTEVGTSGSMNTAIVLGSSMGNTTVDNFNNTQYGQLGSSIYGSVTAIASDTELTVESTNTNSSRARTTIAVTVGDAAHGMTKNQKVTITSTDGTVKDYIVTDTGNSGAATGTALTNGVTNVGGGTTATVTAADGGVAFGADLGTNPTQNAMLAQLRTAILSAAGHNGKIAVGDTSADNNGTQLLALTQSVGGIAGNTTFTENIANFTAATNFTGGGGLGDGTDFQKIEVERNPTMQVSGSFTSTGTQTLTTTTVTYTYWHPSDFWWEYYARFYETYAKGGFFQGQGWSYTYPGFPVGSWIYGIYIGWSQYYTNLRQQNALPVYSHNSVEVNRDISMHITGAMHIGVGSGVELRGFKYGIANIRPLYTSAVYRHNRYGQVRDLLEQRQFTRFFTEDGVEAGPVKVTFTSRPDEDGARSVNVDPASTHSQNLDIFCTSSLPYFDGLTRDRATDPDRSGGDSIMLTFE